MYYCNELISLSVLAISEGELIGVVDKLYFDKKLKKLVSLEIITNNDTRYILTTKNISNIGKNAITIKNKQKVDLNTEQVDLACCPIGAKAYSIQGEYLGVVHDLLLDNKFQTQKLNLDNDKTIPITHLASVGKNTIIFSDNNPKSNLRKASSTLSPNLYKDLNPQSVSIQPVESVQAENTPSISTSDTRASTDFLLGRICTKDIYNFNNELMIKKQSKITKKHLKDASRYGKIRELLLYSKDT